MLGTDELSPPLLFLFFITQMLNCCWSNIYRRGVHL